MTRRAFGAVLAALALTVAGCGVPADPGGTIERIDAGVVRVGASQSGSLVTVDGDEVSGELADLVSGFAQSRGARVSWTVGSEEELVTALEEGGIDLAIGGMTDGTPWSDRVSVTRGYRVPGSADRAIVVLLPMGENGTQAALERYLDETVPR